MNNEIKEILDKLAKKSSIYKFQINQGTSFNTDEYEASILLDYITNLQQTYEKAIKQSKVDHIYASQKEDEAIDYKSRNEKAIEYVKSKKAIINTDYIRIFDLFEIDEQGYTDELLKILQGSEKE